jgi:hypothetical protein
MPQRVLGQSLKISGIDDRRPYHRFHRVFGMGYGERWLAILAETREGICGGAR